MTRAHLSLPFASSFVALFLTGCPSDVVTPGDSDTETSSGDGDGDDDTTTGDDDDTTTGDGDGDPPGVCGDGTVDPGEECDDGNTEDGDGCTANCTIGPCGLSWTWSEPVSTTIAGARATAVGDDGSVYAAGVVVNDTNDAWIAKWSPDGSLAWTKNFNSGEGNDAAAAIALGPDGQVYVAGWMRTAIGGEDVWYTALDQAGEQVWSQLVNGAASGDDRGTGIAVAPDGDLLISGRVRVADGDDDVWVRKARAEDGNETWTSTWSGDGDGMFSTDRSGSVAVASDGSVWVAAREHVAFDTQDATLLAFATNGDLIAAYQPRAGGPAHQHDPIDVAVHGDAVYFAMQKSSGFPYNGWLYKFDFDGSEQWLKTETDWLTVGRVWAVRGIAVDADGTLGVAGTFTNEEVGQGVTWTEAWVAQLDQAGDIVCRNAHVVEDGATFPPSLSIDGASFGAGGFGLSGILSAAQGNTHQLWTAAFKR